MKDIKLLELYLFNTRKDVRQLHSELARLHAELKDIKDNHISIIEEKTHGDEIHCTCVPALRTEIARLREGLKDIERETRQDGIMADKGVNEAINRLHKETP